MLRVLYGHGMDTVAVIGEGSDISRLRGRIEVAGYALLPGLAVGRPTADVAAGLGRPISPWSDALVQELIPRETATPNTYSGTFGLGRFPFHTDLAHWPVPPRYLLLRCVRGYADVPTLMLDGRAIASEAGTELTRRALVRPRRPRNGEIRMLRLQDTHRLGPIIRWDEEYLKPASRVGEVAFSRFGEIVDDAVATPAVMVDEGDVLVIDNWRMLHARPAIPADRRDRRLQRVYLGSLHEEDG
jgi:L-asparagine oxygenase